MHKIIQKPRFVFLIQSYVKLRFLVDCVDGPLTHLSETISPGSLLLWNGEFLGTVQDGFFLQVYLDIVTIVVHWKETVFLDLGTNACLVLKFNAIKERFQYFASTFCCFFTLQTNSRASWGSSRQILCRSLGQFLTSFTDERFIKSKYINLQNHLCWEHEL